MPKYLMFLCCIFQYFFFMAEYIDIESFLDFSENVVIVDVRSPAEFMQGHIPGAVNIPLFSNEERKLVGTIYKQSGKEAAVLRGLDITGPKMSGFVKQARAIAKSNDILLHCWRGGMRSGSMGWLLETAGFNVKLLKGGYKAYRRFVRAQFEKEIKILILGGNTGSGKTEILKEIAKLDHQVIDLEKIAHHKGSSFGAMGQGQQPTSEQFENNLGNEWLKLDYSKSLWLEDESKMIGSVSMPESLYQKIRNSIVVFLDVPKNIREERLVKEYSSFDHKLISAATERIKKRLGGLNVNLALEALENKDYQTVANILLIYYDRAYLKGAGSRDQNTVHLLKIEEDNPKMNAEKVLRLQLP